MNEETNPNEAELIEAMTAQEQLQDYKATAGSPLGDGKEISSLEQIIEAIRQVYDPEIPINVYDMGLIYNIKTEQNGNVLIDMSLTAPGCPVAGILPQQVADAVAMLDGTGIVEVKIVWEPQWTIERMTEEGRAMVDLF